MENLKKDTETYELFKEKKSDNKKWWASRSADLKESMKEKARLRQQKRM